MISYWALNCSYIPGQSAKVWHDDGGVMPGDVVPAKVVDGHQEDVGRPGHERHWQEEEESQKAGVRHLEAPCFSANIFCTFQPKEGYYLCHPKLESRRVVHGID